jgi:quercetin dioxygenase-like cupin family protein
MRTRRNAVSALAFVCLVAAAGLFAGSPIRVTPESIVWTDAPPTLPPGARTAILEGDPKSDGMFTMRASFPPNYNIPLHTHGRDERVTVLSGVVYIGIGEKIEKKRETRFGPGSFYVTPTEVPHWVHTGSEGAVIQATGLGPWSVDYVDPADDPRKSNKEKER